jgi:hypothetical protein
MANNMTIQTNMDSDFQPWLGGKPHKPLGLGNPPLGARQRKKKIMNVSIPNKITNKTPNRFLLIQQQKITTT